MLGEGVGLNADRGGVVGGLDFPRPLITLQCTVATIEWSATTLAHYCTPGMVHAKIKKLVFSVCRKSVVPGTLRSIRLQ